MQASTKVTGPRALSDATVFAKTGRTSTEWYAILDCWGATEQDHMAIASFLREEHGVSGWWAQSLTNRYEWERGLRTEAVVPADLLDALDAAPDARTAFDKLPAGRRHESIRWIEQAKRPETRARRVAETVARISGDRP